MSSANIERHCAEFPAEKPGLRALVIDDHELIRDGMRRVLEDALEFGEVRQAATLDEGLELLGAGLAPDLILVDLNMPGSDGPESLVALVDAFPESSIVVMSASEAKEDVLGSLAAGVDGYVPKSLAVPEMVAALQQVLSGGTFVPRGLTRGASAPAKPRQPLDGLDNLTARQREVVEQLLLGQSSKEIARVLDVAEGTVKIHLAAVYRVLGVNTRAAAISKLMTNGYVPGSATPLS
ncbi:response regulator transcription factor [Sphingosinicella sp. LY1275]|uniref:response regulator transcription factor n=1 Tax=Sphingosinicella sp. LY1275 TaxID=3095379 RepID=UPI002ADEC03D|nr:response regulator transcription factor [Sphingosinicella sp. LY1275]MEA1015962.1 response regulator transcription factor [Sphingosinicella sp. LY1275]